MTLNTRPGRADVPDDFFSKRGQPGEEEPYHASWFFYFPLKRGFLILELLANTRRWGWGVCVGAWGCGGVFRGVWGVCLGCGSCYSDAESLKEEALLWLEVALPGWDGVCWGWLCRVRAEPLQPHWPAQGRRRGAGSLNRRVERGGSWSSCWRGDGSVGARPAAGSPVAMSWPLLSSRFCEVLGPTWHHRPQGAEARGRLWLATASFTLNQTLSCSCYYICGLRAAFASKEETKKLYPVLEAAIPPHKRF